MITEDALRDVLHRAGAQLPDADGHLGSVIDRGRRRRYRGRAGVVAVIAALAVVVVLGGAPSSLRLPVPFAGQGAGDGPAVVIFLCDGVGQAADGQTPCLGAATGADIARLRGALELDDAVARVRVETSEQTYERFAELFADHPELVASVSAADLPMSLRVTLADAADPDEFVDHYEHFDGVDVVVVPPSP